jgi:hypothetical protein
MPNGRKLGTGNRELVKPKGRFFAKKRPVGLADSR